MPNHNKEGNTPLIAVCTTTYNMANTLPRVYESLLWQEYKNFYWLVVDNGSTDNTEEVVQLLKQEQKIDIRYYKKEYEIRAGAQNYVIDIITQDDGGDFMILLDADDQLTKDGLQIFYEEWNKIPIKERSQFWCVNTLCKYADTGEIVGKKFPDNANTPRVRRKLQFRQGMGEKHGMIRTEVLKGLHLPMPKNPQVIDSAAAILWTRLSQRYDSYFSNRITRLYYKDGADSYTWRGNMTQKSIDRLWNSEYFLNYVFSESRKPYSLWFFYIIKVPYHNMVVKKRYLDLLREINSTFDRMLIVLTTPMMYIVHLIRDR